MEDIKIKVIELLKNNPSVHQGSYLENIMQNAFNDVLDFINWKEEELNPRIATPIYDLCLFRYSLTGNEGIISSSKAGTSETYLEDIPKHIKKKLRKYRNLP